MYKYNIGTEVQGAEYIQEQLVSIAEGKIIKRKRWSNENWYTINSGKNSYVFLEDDLMEIIDDIS